MTLRLQAVVLSCLVLASAATSAIPIDDGEGGDFKCGVHDPDAHNHTLLYEDDGRRQLQTIGTMKTLVVRGVMPGVSQSGLLTEPELLAVLQETTDFYNENSANTQVYEWTLYNGGSFVNFPNYNSANCASDTNCPSAVSLSSEIENNPTYDEYNRILYIYEHSCSCFGWKGLGQIRGRKSWVNGEPDLRVLGHEFGHNNGVFHANKGSQEYGNDFSTMGASNNNMHFMVPAKVAMNWITEDQVTTLARPGGCFDYDPCISTCTEASPCTINLYPHDQGSYDAGKQYAVRILTETYDNENLWLEYRLEYPSRFADSADGILLVWSIYRGTTVVGPTQLLDFDETTSSENDAHLEVGKTWVYDFDHVGAVITPLSKEANYMSVSVYFTATVASEVDMLRTGALTAGRVEHATLGCGTTKRLITVPEDKDFLVFETLTQAEGPVTITMQKINCSNVTFDPSMAGIYTYPTYPLQLEMLPQADPRTGLLLFQSFECLEDDDPPDASVEFQVTFEQIEPPSSGAGYSYLEYSEPNYIVLYTGEDSSALDVVISLDETDSCFSDCKTVFVNTTMSDVYGDYEFYDYSTDNLTNETFPRFRKGGILISVDYDMGRWTVASSEQLYAEQADASLLPVFPHIVSSWTQDVEAICVGRFSVVSGTDDADADNTLYRYIFYAAATVVLALAALVPYIVYNMKKKNKKTRSDLEAPPQKFGATTVGFNESYASTRQSVSKGMASAAGFFGGIIGSMKSKPKPQTDIAVVDSVTATPVEPVGEPVSTPWRKPDTNPWKYDEPQPSSTRKAAEYNTFISSFRPKSSKRTKSVDSSYSSRAAPRFQNQAPRYGGAQYTAPPPGPPPAAARVNTTKKAKPNGKCTAGGCSKWAFDKQRGLCRDHMV